MHSFRHNGEQPELDFPRLEFEALQAQYPGQVFRYCELRPSVHPEAHLASGAVITGDVRMHEDSSIWCNAVARGDINYIEIGPGSNVQDNSVLHVANTWPCVIGELVTVGHRAIVHGTQVEDGALVGMGAIVLNGTTVGEGALVAAGAVVPEETEIPPRTLWAGVPARQVRELDDDEDLSVLAKKYTGVAARYRNPEEHDWDLSG